VCSYLLIAYCLLYIELYKFNNSSVVLIEMGKCLGLDFSTFEEKIFYPERYLFV